MPELPPSLPTGRPKFTVLVSICQLEPWMRQAIDSVARQTYPGFECILHVEESTDDSLAIANGVAARDGRFRVVSAPRSGSGGTARNYAIDHANGEYLVFLDGDDLLADDALARLAARLDQTGAVDILSFSARSSPPIPGGTIGNFRPADAADGVFSGMDAIRRAARNGGLNAGQFRAYVWLSAYRTDFLRGTGLRQPEGRLMEDMGWTPCIWFFSRRFACLNGTLYVYRRRANSVMSESSPRLLFDLVAQIRSLVDFAESHDVPGDIRSIWANQWLAHLYWFLFHSVSSRKYSNADRQRAISALFGSGGKKKFLRLARHASLLKRMALPFLLLGTRGWQTPGKLFFRHLYYPISARFE